MRTEAPKADALYILGDLFEVWIGDDNTTPFNDQVASSIRGVSRTTPVYFIHGNRDFAIGKRFAERCNMTILPEQHVIDLYGEKVLLSHGDEFCTRDVDYMKFRKKARSWWWPRLIALLPLKIRRQLADKGRQESKRKQQFLAPEIMDVTKSEIDRALYLHKVNTIIHGHTHRPNIHVFDANGESAKRIVLGDWYDQGSILVATKNDIQLQTRQFAMPLCPGVSN